jgi:hypothetical protein
MMTFQRELRQLTQKRRKVTTWTFMIVFILLLGTGGGFFIALIGATFFSTIARMGVTHELEKFNRRLYLGGKKPWA